MAGRKPDYKASCMNVLTNVRQGRIGVAWNNPDGTINIKFDPFVRVPVGADYVIKLWPYEQDERNEDTPS